MVKGGSERQIHYRFSTRREKGGGGKGPIERRPDSNVSKHELQEKRGKVLLKTPPKQGEAGQLYREKAIESNMSHQWNKRPE